MTQRYTKLGHSPNKTSQARASVKKENKKMKESAPEELIIANADFKNTGAKAEAGLVSDHVVTFKSSAVSKRSNPLLKVGNTAVSLVKQQVEKSNAQKLKPNKTFKEKVSRAAGLFDTLFKIVLFAIILAILVAIIIIIILT